MLFRNTYPLLTLIVWTELSVWENKFNRKAQRKEGRQTYSVCQAENIGFEYDHRGLQELILFYLIFFEFQPLELNMQIYAHSANWSMPD